MPKIKAIETRYKNYRFRSRLEARWAVYMDAMGIAWDYEPEGFDLGDSGYYLPDFYLPKLGHWAEVKAGKPTFQELKKAVALFIMTRKPVIILDGMPDDRSYYFVGGLATEDCGNPWGYPGISMLDLYMCEYECEGRFFVATGCQCATEEGFDEVLIGIAAARSARFEHGESG